MTLKAFNIVGLGLIADAPATRTWSRLMWATKPCPRLRPPDLASSSKTLQPMDMAWSSSWGGGVGKTTLAAAVAVELAERGFPVHLTTSDPVAHLARTLEGTLPHLVSRIDPHAETERYRQHVLATKGAKLDAEGRALLEEDLRSPAPKR